jgi:hypothetical protein
MKRFFGVLVIVLLLVGCGGGGGGSSSGASDSTDFSINGSLSQSVIPVGGPYSVSISGSSNEVTDSAGCEISDLVVTGTMNNIVVDSAISLVSLVGSSNDLEVNGFVVKLVSDGPSNSVWFYGDVSSVELNGSLCEIHLPVGSTASVINSGSVNQVYYDLPAIQ